MELDKMLEELIKTKAEELVTTAVEKYFKDARLKELITQIVETKLNAFMIKDETCLEDLTTEAMSKEAWAWVENNISRNSLQTAAKDALIDKFKAMTPKELIDTIKTN